MLGDRVTTGRLTIALLTSLAPVGAAILPTVLAAPAFAQQVQTVTPFYAVATQDKATVRCGSNDRFYKVGELATGQVVLVDGEGEAWSRISYTSSMSAFVRVEDVKVDGATATIINASKLRAANTTNGFQGSWKSLFETALPAGTTLKVIEPAKEGDGIIAYRVAAPDSARAFVESRALRHATDAEVEAFKAHGNVPALPQPAKAETPAAAPGNTPGVKPVAPTPAGPDGKTATLDKPNAQQPGAKTDGAKPDAPKDAKQQAEEREVASLEALETKFKAVWKQPPLTSEVGELMTEYNRAIQAAKNNPERQRILQQRVDAMKLRLEFRDTLRKQEEARAALDKDKVRMAEEVANWEKSRVYTIVGELQPSTVYDGKQLPLMYRVVSAGAGARTLGYLKNSDKIDMTKMIGQVVGVIGDATMDRSLMLNIINPIRVDTLKSAPEKPSANVDDQSDK